MSREQKRRDYDSTVARIAGNLLSGVLRPGDLEQIALNGITTDACYMACGAVEVARAIVREVKRTEPVVHPGAGAER